MSGISFMQAMELGEQGFDRWAAKPHNAKWVRRIDGTPIKNDLLVNIATVIAEADSKTPDTLDAPTSALGNAGTEQLLELLDKVVEDKGNTKASIRIRAALLKVRGQP